MPDRGLTHVALAVTDADASVAFYRAYAGMEVVHQRTDPATGHRVVWVSDRTRPFVVVLIEHDPVDPLGGINHLGIGCGSRADVDERCARAARDGALLLGPLDEGPPVGYWALLRDPDGHNVELSFGQEVGLAVFGGDGDGAGA